jgi:hypothetical protein
MQTKLIEFPTVINNYFRASADYDQNMLAECFTENAVLYDEGKEFHGRNAIKEHIVGTNKTFQVKEEIKHAVTQKDEIVVTTIVSGTFEGSPCALAYHFKLENRMISCLNIVLASE